MKLPPGIERMYRWVEGQLTTPSPPSTPAIEARRTFIAGVLKLATLGVVFSESKRSAEKDMGDIKTTVETREVREKAVDFDENELTENRIHAFRLVFGKLTRKEIILVDQHWNVISGGPLTVPQEVEEAPEITRVAVFQEWVNRERTRLKERYPSLEFDTNPQRANDEKPELYSTRILLKDAPERKTHFDIVEENAKQRVSDGGTRIEFTRKIFARTKLPEALQELLVALPGIESAYDPQLVHPETKATGAWQIMEELGREIGITGERKIMKKRRVRRGRRRIQISTLVKVPFDHRKDFETSTEAIAHYFDQLYKEFRTNKDIQTIMRLYGLREEDFLYPLVLNAYHSGAYRTVYGYVRNGTRYESMVQWFLKEYSPQRVKKEIGAPPYGRDIYTLMSVQYARSREDPRYFRASRDYYAKVAAMRDLLEDNRPFEYSSAYSPPETEIVERDDLRESKPTGLSLKNPILYAGLGTTLHALISDVRGKLSRRTFLHGASLNTVAASLGVLLKITSGPRKLPPPGIPTPLEKLIPTDLASQFIYDPNLIAKIGDTFQLDVALLGEGEHTALRRYRNPHLREWIEKFGDRTGLASVTNIEELEDLHPRLLQLRERGSFYRLRGIGNPHGGMENNMDYAWVRENAGKLIEELGQEVNEEAYAHGLPKRYQIRLIVTGAARTEAYQKRLRKMNPHAALWSSHTFLNSFDLAYLRFDILNRETGQFGMVNGNSLINRETRLAEKFQALLGRAILKRMRERKILAFREGGTQPCFHIMALD